MYTPKYNQEKDWNTIAAFIRENSFAMLVNTAPDGVPLATHLPVELVEKTAGEFVLQGHIAKINPQWESFTTGTTLVVFTAPHAYISSSWYEKDKIPTWNYIAIHVYGQIRIQETAELQHSLEQLMNRYEAASAHPVHMRDIDDKTLHNNLKAIVGFELTITEVNARYKLSQNRNDRDYASVVTHLKEAGGENALQIAAEMEKRRKL
ncbi:FMN-binding negative transcriptional regulator [Chitinophaga defluvii]|uniref:FMN-binding negative transcriptional regulator n=1 Tax=Chitinophaga defluvii TaxID=3163343 RepID=A0ABV2T0I6_9BACT